jgi:hypothetical protein
VKYLFVYGAIAGAIVVSVITFGIAFDLPNHVTLEWFGYLVMLVALSLIFVGVKRYRDVESGGIIKFGPAFGLGLGIAAVAALVYVLGWEIYLAASGRDFMAEHSASIIEGMRADGASAAAIQSRVAELQGLTTRYRSPLFRIPVTFVEIFPVGLLISLMSAALLRNPKLLPAKRSPAAQGRP